jgi:fibro-slime domain-containing protein
MNIAQHPLKLITALGLVGITTPLLAANTISVPVTIRDFAGKGQIGPLPVGVLTHPDFQKGIITSAAGIVGPLGSPLGGDGTPVYDVAGAPFPSVTSAASFYDWYHSNPTYNVTVPVPSLTLSETAPGSGIFQYSNAPFFPIEGLGFGNFATANENFGHTLFTYSTGQVLNFKSDDDLFVFINQKLALDLGGVHAAKPGTINLGALGLISGQTYSFDLFYAERYTTEAALTFQVPALADIPLPEANAFYPAVALFGAVVLIGNRRRQK